MDRCEKCQGSAGAHYAWCFLANLWDRLMGPAYPLFGPMMVPTAEAPAPPRSAPEAVDRPVVLPFRRRRYPETRGNEGFGTRNKAIVAHFLEEHTAPAGLANRHMMRELYAAFCEWAKHLDAPDVSPKSFAMALRANGYPGKQASVNNVKGQVVYGLRLKPIEELLEAGDADPKARRARETAQFRALLRELKRPAPRPTTREEAPPPVRRDQNNGWWTLRAPAAAPVVDGARPAVAVVRAPRRDSRVYTGPRPGRELPKYWREIARALIDQGWSYELGKKHPRMISPQGHRVTLPSTVTDGHAGHRAAYLSNLKRAGAPIDRGVVVKHA